MRASHDTPTDDLISMIEIKPDDIDNFHRKSGIVREFEWAHQMRLEPMLCPYPQHRRVADAVNWLHV